MTSKPRQSISKIPSPSSSSPSPVQSRLFTTVQHDLSPLDFENEKSVQSKIEEIVSEFQAKDKDWGFRLKALILLQRVVSGNAVEMKSWLTILRYMTLPLLDQLTEIRATIAKEACQVVTLLAQRMKNRFEPYALQYLYTLIKLVVCKVTVTADAAHQTVIQVLENIQTKSLLQTFLDSSLDQHNEQLRRRSTDYILIIINRAIEEPGMILTSSVPALEKSIDKLLTDSGSDIRQQARFCFWAYAELNEERALAMFYQMTTTTQRNLFSIEEKLTDAQKEVADKIRQAIIEEEENQKLVEESTDLDLDISDFRNNSSSNANNSSNNDSSRAKTPTSSSGRASGLKSRVNVNLSSNSASSSSNSPSGIKPPSDIKRSGSSLGMKSGTNSPSFEERSIKKPDPLMRSKSSLGTSRRLSEIPSGSSGSAGNLSSKLSNEVSILKSKTSSTSPNLSTSNMSGRYSSIGTRGTTSGGSSSLLSSTLTKSSSNSSLTRSLPPGSSSSTITNKSSSGLLMKSTPPPTSTAKPTTSTSNSITSNSILSATTTPRPPSSSLLKRPTTTTLTSSMIKKPTTVAPVVKQQAPPTLTKSKSSASMNNIASTSTNKTNPTTTTTTSTSTLTKKSTTAIKPKAEDTNDLINNFKSRKDSITNNSITTNDIDIESIEESLTYSKDAFNEISQELEGSLRDAKNNLDDFTPNQLTLDDIDGGLDISERSIKRRSMKRSGSNDDFNWIEDSIGQDLIENDPLDFNEFLSKNKNDNNIETKDFSDLTLNELTINEEDQNGDDDEMY